LIARLSVAVLVFALAFSAAGVAGAATLSNPPSAVDQYVEILPSGDGSATPGKTTTPLSHDASHALAATDRSTAAALREVATSSAFGAPEAKLALPKSARASSALPSASFVGSLKEMGSSILGGGGSAIGLLAGLAVIAAAVALMARRKNSPTS
jgi:hypothetical protein